MICPLYQEVVQRKPWQNAPTANRGLLFDKYASAWRKQGQTCEFDKGGPGKEGAGDWLRSFANKAAGEARLLEEACQRQRELVTKLGGKTLLVKNTSRFVTGMGREHPLENGFTWHHTLGVPYLPGSSVKGLLRAWYRENGSWDEAIGRWCEESATRTLFGSLEKDKNGNVFGVGRCSLLDMLPVSPPRLVVEIMTPHYLPYYQDDKGTKAPGDWHSPIPISFLAVEADQSWQMAVLPGPRHRTISDGDLAELHDQLLEALEWLGAGAKTAVGYGRFERDAVTEDRIAQEEDERRAKREAAAEAAREQAEFEASMASDSEPLRELKRICKQQDWQLTAGDHNMISALEKFADKNPNPAQDCLDWIRDLLESIHGYKGVWEDPNAMKGKKKDKNKYSAKAVRELVNRLNPKRWS